MPSLKIATFVLLFLSVSIQLCVSLSALRSSGALEASGQTAATIVDPEARKQAAKVIAFHTEGFTKDLDDNFAWEHCEPLKPSERKEIETGGTLTAHRQDAAIVWKYLDQIRRNIYVDENDVSSFHPLIRSEVAALYKEIETFIYNAATEKRGRLPTGAEVQKDSEAAFNTFNTWRWAVVRFGATHAAHQIFLDVFFLLRDAPLTLPAMYQLALGTEEEFFSTLTAKALEEPWTPLSLFALAAHNPEDPETVRFGAQDVSERMNLLLNDAAAVNLQIVGVESREQKQKVLARIHAFVEAHRERMHPWALRHVQRLALQILPTDDQ